MLCLYRAFTAVAQQAVALGGIFFSVPHSPGSGPAVPKRSKIAKGILGRRKLIDRFFRWAAEHRDPTKPLIWIHASSYGEGLMALPLIESLGAGPDVQVECQIVYTYFSPSAEKFARSLPVDYTDFLPIDSVSSAQKMLSILQPSCIVFSKLDVWPNLVREASACGVPTGLISGSLPSNSSRSRGIGKILSQTTYPLLTYIGAASQGDADNFLLLGVPPTRLSVTGDTRYDQAWKRAHSQRSRAAEKAVQSLSSAGEGEREAAFSRTFCLVAGSTWPPDEKVILEGWARFVRGHARHQTDAKSQLIIAPHEISSTHIESLIGWAQDRFLRALRLSDVTAHAAVPTDKDNIATHDIHAADIIIIDSVGILADLYTVGNAAYVGGGFHDKGLHSLVEPAVFNLPIAIGPKHRGSRDAFRMIEAGAVRVVNNAEEFTEWLAVVSDDGPRLHTMRESAKRIVAEELGATRRSVELVLKMLRSDSSASGSHTPNTSHHSNNGGDTA